MNVWPCLDENRRYRSFPCSQCTAEGCVFGKKPEARPVKKCIRCGDPMPPHLKAHAIYCGGDCKWEAGEERKREHIKTHPAICGYRECRMLFQAQTRGLYCSEAHRYAEMMLRRRARKVVV